MSELTLRQRAEQIVDWILAEARTSDGGLRAAMIRDRLERDFAAAARAAGLVQCAPDRAGWWWFTGYDLYGERELDRPVEVRVGAAPVLWAVTAGEGSARALEELEGEWRWLGKGGEA